MNREVLPPPIHPLLCDTIVEVPTLRMARAHPGIPMPEELFVQWYADNKDRSPELDMSRWQFLFPVNTACPIVHWKTDLFRVAYLGPVRDLPHPASEEAGEVARLYTRGNPDEWIIWWVSPHFLEGDGRGAFGSGFDIYSKVAHFSSALGDPIYGVITPRTFSDIEVVRRAEREAEPRIHDANERLRRPVDEGDG